MENRDMTTNCQGLADYMAGEMSDVERKRFERHLDTCAACREDAAEWRLVWDRLSEDAPELELPADLKAEVMDSIFGQTESDNPAERQTQTVTPDTVRSRKPIANVYRRVILAAVIAAAFFAGFAGRGLLPSGSEQAAVPAMAAPSQIEKLVRLSPEEEVRSYAAGKNAYGVACMIKSAGETRLVVYVFGTPKTEGEQAYHVWLLKDGTRRSAGTFTVGSSGIGLLTVPWKDDFPSFDHVGVTLEPDAGTTSPQGPKMFGSA
ncbi:anti-sigma factor [Cohnella candidum]|uniref:Anti-sigma-W factor RsiW n=1 Tax=Cohnella candidum TaxID=2674991 RepID=A0A3G3JWE7_9BACL|nr:anti-sigma factor [Cohnella candidum]AYQ72562.1 hypothetical protein EAV92_08265 [Cohnella candidum]